MTPLLRFAAFLIAILFTGAGFAQIPTDQADENVTEATTAAPVAHVYVSTPNGIDLYDAASNGKLTLVSGSPFEGKVSNLVTTGKYFFATDNTYIYQYSVSPSGALTLFSTLNPGSSNPDFKEVYSLNLEHTGATLYCGILGYSTAKYFQAYRISKSNGDLTILENWDSGDGYGPLSILGNNKFAFETAFYSTWYMSGYELLSNGTITGITENVFPIAKSGERYNSYAITADPANHLAVAVYAQQDPPDGPIVGPTQLAVYTSDSAGNLTTTSTYENMPAVKVAAVSKMNMSPSGKLLAVAGNGPGVTGAKGPAGLQVFHFDGPSPITDYTGLITTTPIDNLHWDNANHLFATSESTGKLYVFTVTPTSVSEAPGSPYNVSSPSGLAVVPIL